jgi:transcription initiation factor TFIID subunit TAF12
MTWTEPLTRQLQDLVKEHFPNQSKVNWAMISSLMGSSPAVSKDQCKRRWYLISQQQLQQQQQQQQQQQYVPIHGHLEYRQLHDPSEAMQA